jgi:hypothetical protein
MKHIRRFNEGFIGKFNEIKDDIDGLLIELRDTNKFEIDTQYHRQKHTINTLSILIGKSGAFYNARVAQFKVEEIYDDLKTIEDYLIAHKYEFRYTIEYYDSDTGFNFDRSENEYNSIDEMDLSFNILYLYLTINI